MAQGCRWRKNEEAESLMQQWERTLLVEEFCMEFEEVITTHHRLRELSRQPSHRANNKIINHIDDICSKVHRRLTVCYGRLTRG